jgi:hypothetical protein
MKTGIRCTRCGRAITPGLTGKEADEQVVEIRRVRVTVDGRVEAQGENGERASGDVQKKGKAYVDGVGLVDPHISLTSSDESHKLLCSQCLQVLLPILFPPHPQPLRVTIGLEDARLIRGILPAVLATCGAGHLEVEQANGDTLLVHFYSESGNVESYTVGRAGDLVRIPSQRPAGTSLGRRVDDADSCDR